MSDRDFIVAHYNSFIDNVLLNQSPEFWSCHFTGDDDDSGYLMDSLRHAVSTWRARLEAEDNVEVDVPQVTPKSPVNAHMGPGWVPNMDPPDSERWYDAIDRDDDYQRTFCGKD